MSVNIFGQKYTKFSEKASSVGFVLAQANNLFLRRDGKINASDDMDLNSHKITNISDPENPQDGATKNYVDNRIPLPSKKFLVPYATDVNTITWSDRQGIEPDFSENDFDELPAGKYACFTTYLPATRLGDLPINTKGYLDTITYQQPVDRNKYYKWINSVNGDVWEAYFRNGTWVSWVLNKRVSATSGGPAFCAYSDDAQAYVARTVSKLDFTKKRFDTDNKYDTIFCRFTPRKAGIYLINVNIEFTPGGKSEYTCNIFIYKNLSSYRRLIAHMGESTSTDVAGTMLLELSETDYVEAYVRADILGSINLTEFSGAFIRTL